MYLQISPDFSLKSEVIFNKFSSFFDIDSTLVGQDVLLYEQNLQPKKLIDIQSVHQESALSSLDGVFLYRTLSQKDVDQINDWAVRFPHLHFYIIESGFFSIVQEAIELLPQIQSRIKIISSTTTHQISYPQFKYIFINKAEYKKKTARPLFQNPAVLLRKLMLLLIKFFLTPVQSVKDFYATYNLKFFYGKISILFGLIWSFLSKYTPKYVFGMVWSFFAKYTPKYVFGMIWSFFAKYTPKYVFGMIWSFFAKYTPKYVFGMIWSFFAKYTPKYVFGMIWSFFAKYTPKYVFGMVWSFFAKYNWRYIQGYLWMSFFERVYNFFCKYNLRYLGGLIWVWILKIFFTVYRWIFNLCGFLWLCLVRMIWGIIFVYHRIHEFNLRYTYYPFRWMYWTIRYQYRKRILGIHDESV